MLKKVKTEHRIIFLSVFLASVSLLTVFAIKKCFLFGDASFASGSAFVQYVPLLEEMRARIFDGGFLYSWADGLGFSFYASGAYNLSSPLTLLAILVPGLTVFDAFDLAVLLKVAAAAGTFSYYLLKSFGEKKAAIPAFTLCYVFCGFFTAYSFNIIWFDALIFLPLIALGIERITEEKSGILYCVSLALAIFTCFYTGFMLCLFSVLYFFVRILGDEGLTQSHEKAITQQNETDSPSDTPEDSDDAELEGRALLPLLAKFGIYSLLAGALAAVSLIPIYYALRDLFISPEQEMLLFNLSDFLLAHLFGTNSAYNRTAGAQYPFLYSGMLSLLLAPLLLFVKKIRLGERIAYAALTLIFAASLLFSGLNTLWHGLSVPSGLPHRFAFLYSFALITIAYRVFLHIDSIKGWFIGAAAALCVGIPAVLLSFGYENYSIKQMLVGIIFALLLSAALLSYKYLRKKRNPIAAVIVLLIFAETLINTTMDVTIKKADEGNGLISQKQAVALAADAAKDGSLYRSEVLGDTLHHGMKGSFFGINGVSSFNALYDETLTYAIGGLGISNDSRNAFTYTRQTPVFDSFLGIRYLYDFKETGLDGAYYTRLGEYGADKNAKTAIAYEYKYPLPFAFAVNNTITDWAGAFLSDFRSQNTLFKNACGIQNVFSIVKAQDSSANNATVVSYANLDIAEDQFTPEQLEEYKNGLYQVSFAEPEKVKVTLSYTVQTDEPLYFFYSSDLFASLTVGVNSNEYTYVSEAGLKSHILPVDGVKKGDKLTFTAQLSDTAKQEYIDGKKVETNTALVWLKLYSFNEEKFSKGYDYLKAGALNVSEYGDTYIKGTITAKKNQKIFTSIPYNDGWHAYIDGKEAEVLCPENTHLILLDADEGEHTLELKYEVPGLKVGLAVSFGALLLFILAVFIERRADRRRLKD